MHLKWRVLEWLVVHCKLAGKLHRLYVICRVEYVKREKENMKGVRSFV